MVVLEVLKTHCSAMPLEHLLEAQALGRLKVRQGVGVAERALTPPLQTYREVGHCDHP